MTENSFEAGGRQFKLSKINAMKQFHIVRRIGPILGDLLPTLKNIAASKKDVDQMSEDEKLDQAVHFAGPIMDGLAKLSDKDAEFVLYGLLAAAEMKQEGGNWARIVQGDTLMFDNLGLPLMIQVAGRSFMYNLAGFFDVLQRSS